MTIQPNLMLRPSVTIRTTRGRAASSMGVMSTKVTLPDDLADELARVAAERGVSVDQVVAELVATQLSEARSAPLARRRLAFAGIGASTSGRGAADADEMLAEGFGRD